MDEDALERQAALDQAAEWEKRGEMPTEDEVDAYLASLD